ncbi:MAG: YihY/virulence factor BrkB family protein [Micromonosporaceae bacterium]|nr:YihY/virulence factor BrkB family protein [Micromonosporaceae bacterium]
MSILGRVRAAIAAGRRRSRDFDRFWRAADRYAAVSGSRLAAAIAYYAFFASFALGLLAISILGYVLSGNRTAEVGVQQYLTENLPFLKTSDIQSARHTVAIVGLVGLALTGANWVDGMCTSQRAMWRLDQSPGNLFLRRLVDLAMLVGLGLLLFVSLWATNGIQTLAIHLWTSLVPRHPLTGHLGRGLLSILGLLLSFAVNVLMAAALLAAVPRLRVPPRRLFWPAMLVAAGLTLLSTVGRVLIHFTQRNPAYQVAGWAVGLLVFLNLFSQLLLFGAALLATSDQGRVVDLATRRPVPAAAQESGQG